MQRLARAVFAAAVAVGCQSNTAPEVTIDAPSDGDVVNEGASVTFSASVSDAQDEAADIDVSWSSDVDGSLGTGASLTLDTLSRGAHVVTATAEDSGGRSTEAQVGLTVNALPSQPVVSLPAAPTTTDDLVAVLDTAATDADADEVTYGYAWYESEVLAAAHTTATLPASATARGDTWRVEVTPGDGFGIGPAGTASTTVVNSAPVLAAVTLPATAYTDSLLAAAVTATDADGDGLSYAYTWTVNVDVVDEDGGTLDGLDHFVRDDTVTVTVVASDGLADTAPVTSGAAAIVNAPPGAPVVSITPPDPAAGIDDVACVVDVEAPDADGDAVTYAMAWTAGGLAFNGNPETTTWTDDTVLGIDTFDGEMLACAATPDDGFEPGPAGTASVTPTGCMLTATWEVDGEVKHTVSFAEDGVPDPAWIRLQVWGNTQFVSANGQFDNLLVTSLLDDATLQGDDFSSAGDWQPSGGCVGSVQVTGGVADAQSDWNMFYSGVGVSLADGVRIEVDAMASSYTSHLAVALDRNAAPGTCGVCSTSGCPTELFMAYNTAGGTQAFRLPDGSTDYVSDVFIPLAEWHTYALEVEPSASCE